MNLINVKAAFRSIRKSKLQSIICIAGIGVGMGSVILVGLLAIHEHSFDRYIPGYKNVFRVIYGNDIHTSYPLVDKAKEEIPAVVNGFRFLRTGDGEIEFRERNNEISMESGFGFADTEIFDCLGLTFRQGRAAKEKYEIAISEDMAKKHFGEAFPIGETMDFNINNEFRQLIITGVYKNIPSNSSIDASYIANIRLSEELSGSNSQMLGYYGGPEFDYLGWDNTVFASYIVLNDKESATDVGAILDSYKEYISNEESTESTYSLQPVEDIYLGSGDLNGNTYARGGNPNDLYYYLTISLLIFVISLINFIVLTRARTDIRAGEMGTKKAMGARPGQIRSQIVTESFLMITLGTVPAILLIILGIPFINKTLGQNIDLSVFIRPETWMAILFIFAATGLISGFFIGQRLSAVPIPILLKGDTSIKRKNHGWGNSVLTVHFFIFILLTASVITLEKQISFALKNYSALNPENILIYELNTSELSAKYDVLKTEIEKVPGTVKVAGSSFIPPFNMFLPIRLASPEGEQIQFDGLIMGEGMADLLGMEFIWGKDFGEFQEGVNNVIFNESAVKEYHITEGENFLSFNIKGVVKDFNAHSLHSLIQPMVIIQQHPERCSLIAIKTDGKNDKAIIATMKGLLKEMTPGQYVTGYYLTDQINGFYQNEERQSKLVKAFALLAIILSIMGLFGMVVNTTSRKTKEIGIRKVNGAKISELIVMLNMGFIKWIALAFVIATPVTWYIMHRWMESFAYRTALSWWIFALTGLLALAIAIITVSWHSWRTATRNPVEALRYE